MPLSKRPVVLVTADDPHTLETIASVLGGAGYQLEVAHDGKEALEFLEKNNVGVVLLGCEEGFGPRSATLVRKLRETGKVPVIALSSDMDVLRQAGAASVSDYLPIPLQAEDLLHVVDEHYADNAA